MYAKHSWQCPFCGQFSTISEHDRSTQQHSLSINNKHGLKAITTRFIVCPNPACKEFTLEAELYDTIAVTSAIVTKERTKTWSLVPQSKAKVFPDYVPKPIRDDYEEACKIVNDSPKASATLSRRCLQGMIRDFWGINKPRLIDEIEAIKDKVDSLTWKAIDATRKIGNIGAHMEKDINLIIDVDPEEAELLIKLIETLIKDWYITTHERQEGLEKILAVRDAKEAAKKAP